LLVSLIRGKSCQRPQQMGQDFPGGVLAIQEMAAVRVNALVKKVTSLDKHRDQIIAAIDFLTTGI